MADGRNSNEFQYRDNATAGEPASNPSDCSQLEGAALRDLSRESVADRSDKSAIRGIVAPLALGIATAAMAAITSPKALALAAHRARNFPNMLMTRPEKRFKKRG